MLINLQKKLKKDFTLLTKSNSSRTSAKKKQSGIDTLEDKCSEKSLKMLKEKKSAI